MTLGAELETAQLQEKKDEAAASLLDATDVPAESN